jgi:hypothetical protein
MRVERVAIEIGASPTNIEALQSMYDYDEADDLAGLNRHLDSIGCGCVVSDIVSIVMELIESNYSLRHQNSMD